MLRIADTYYGEEKYAEAQVEYRAFINFHPVHRDASYAQYQVGMCSYQEITTIDRDPALTRTALKEFQALLTKYPGSPYEEEATKYITICRDKLAEYELYVGRFYHKKGSYLAAVGRLEKLLKDYPARPRRRMPCTMQGSPIRSWAKRPRRSATSRPLRRNIPPWLKRRIP